MINPIARKKSALEKTNQGLDMANMAYGVTSAFQGAPTQSSTTAPEVIPAVEATPDLSGFDEADPIKRRLKRYSALG